MIVSWETRSNQGPSAHLGAEGPVACTLVRDAELRPVEAVADQLGLGRADLELHGPHRAKIRGSIDAVPGRRGRLLLVTAMTPGERSAGKTVTALGLGMGLHRLGRRAVVTLRQSALGPTLGAKGGGAGGGAARIEPFVESLLGLGADTFAVEAAHNLLAAVVEDALHRNGDVDPASIFWRRVLDVDDRSLRDVRVGLGPASGPPRASGFDITPASEVTAVVALSRDLADLRDRLASIVPASDRGGRPITAGQLGTAGAMAALLRDAFAPNLLQTSEGTAVLVHMGPFGNVAPGCSSVVADRFALGRAEYVVTEAGFGADLGAEKFVHLKSPLLEVVPDAAVLVATVGCLREHGGGHADTADLSATRSGCANLRRHLGILASFGIPTVVAINRFPDDTADELAAVGTESEAAGALAAVVHTAYTDGGRGCVELAEAVIDAAAPTSACHPLVDRDAPIVEKVDTITRRVYGGSDVEWTPTATAQLRWLERHGFGRLPVCMAKTQRSLSHDPHLRGAPSGFTVPVASLRLAAGAGYVTVLAGDISTMPGLPAHPRFRDIDLRPDGAVTGLS